MSVQSDLVTALSGVAGGRVGPWVESAGVTRPFVVYVPISSEPTRTLDGTLVAEQSTFDLLCVADTYAAALTLRDQVRTAVLAAAALSAVEEAFSGSEYEFAVDVYVEGARFTFWH